MALPRQHTWDCLYFGNDADCATCHPQATCKNCGHTANQHSFTDAPIKFRWCPKCRGCGPQKKEQPTMKHLRIYMLDGRVHHFGLDGDVTVEIFKVAMQNGHTLNCTTGRGNPLSFNGKYITCLQVCDGPMPAEENC